MLKTTKIKSHRYIQYDPNDKSDALTEMVESGLVHRDWYMLEFFLEDTPSLNYKYLIPYFMLIDLENYRVTFEFLITVETVEGAELSKYVERPDDVSTTFEYVYIRKGNRIIPYDFSVDKDYFKLDKVDLDLKQL